jgi:SAM-dependent methyltransferase
VGAVDPDAFNAFESAGWEEVAVAYDGYFGSLTGQTIEPLLDAASVGAGTRVLDVATGPGHVAGHASRRGALAVGVDIARAMVELARKLHPGLDFREADAQALPFEDACFDAVVGNFAILHLGRPEHAVAEFVRTLAPGGALALTVWGLPVRMRIIGVLVDVVQEVGATPPEDLPVGPDFFRFSVDDEFERLLREGGLEDCGIETIAFTHRVASADELWDGLTGATVRMSALVMAQPEETRQEIREGFDRRMDDFQTADGFELPVSVKLASGRKPG